MPLDWLFGRRRDSSADGPSEGPHELRCATCGTELGDAPEDETLGVVEVDSGTILLSDPAYVLPRASTGKAGLDYDAAVSVPDLPAQYILGTPAILLGGFGGDGTFPVFGEFDEYGEVLRSTIEFDEPDTEDDEDTDG